MTRGRSGDKTFTGYNGVATDRLRAADKMRNQSAGQFGRHAAPSADALRAYIKAGRCPWCDRGPFQSLGSHVSLSHGISAAEVKELAGMLKGEPLCSADLSRRCAERMAGQRLPDSAYTNNKGRPHVYGTRGRQSQKAKAANLTDTRRRQVARVVGDRMLAANADRHAEVLRRWNDGDSTTAIAEAVGFARVTVVQILRRADVYVDGRARRWTKEQA